MEQNQPYLERLYTALLASGYYGLLRIGEMTKGPHCLLADNVHLATNKKKLLYILPSSKTHSKGEMLQMIKIASTPINSQKAKNSADCPYHIIQEYIDIRPEAASNKEQFFVFSDRSPICPVHLRKMLKLLLIRIKIDPRVFSVHSLRIGHNRGPP